MALPEESGPRWLCRPRRVRSDGADVRHPVLMAIDGDEVVADEGERLQPRLEVGGGRRGLRLATDLVDQLADRLLAVRDRRALDQVGVVRRDPSSPARGRLGAGGSEDPLCADSCRRAGSDGEVSRLAHTTTLTIATTIEATIAKRPGFHPCVGTGGGGRSSAGSVTSGTLRSHRNSDSHLGHSTRIGPLVAGDPQTNAAARTLDDNPFCHEAPPGRGRESTRGGERASPRSSGASGAARHAYYGG